MHQIIEISCAVRTRLNYYRLIDLVPVSLDTGPVNITVNQSSSASFKCVASGDPKPNITWSKGGVLLRNEGRVIITGETLSITRTNASDAGEYQCHVTNGLATHVGKAHLVVQGKLWNNFIALFFPFPDTYFSNLVIINSKINSINPFFFQLYQTL